MNKPTDAQTIRIASLYQHLAGNLVATFLTSLVLAFYLSGIADVKYAGYWLAAIILVTFLRISLFRVYRRFLQQKVTTQTAAVAFGVGALFAGISWGSAFLVVPSDITLATTYVAIFVACVMALTCNTYQASSSAVIAFNIPIVIIVVGRFAFSGQGQILAVGVLIYSALLAYNSRNTARRIHREIELQLSNEILIEDLAAQKSKSENLNRELESKVQQRTESLHLLNGELREEITERQHIEDELLASEARFRALYHEHPSILLTLDSNGFITNINDYGANYLGYSHTTILRKKFSELSTSSEDVKTLLNSIIGRSGLNENRSRVELVKAAGGVITTQATARKVPSTENEADNILIVCEDVTEIDQLQQQLAYLASRDTLTALYNRREFETRINQLFERAKRHGGDHILCLIDLDHFKLINDTSGHIAGDEILKSISEAMKSCMRQTDVLARLGGDEFGIIMEETTLQDASQIIERLRNAIEKIELTWDGTHHKISASFGLAELGNSAGTVDDVMRDADAACYLAKKSGRNCVRIADIESTRSGTGVTERGWSSRLRDAIESENLVLALQPVMNRRRGCVDQYEALLRIQDGPGGFSDAHLFVSAAERFGLITGLDKWVFENSLKLLHGDSRFSGTQKLSLNVSATSIADKGFTEHVFGLLEKNQTISDRLCIEIREVDILRDTGSIKKFIQTIQAYGINLTIDDFGSSFASFAYLEKLGVDFVKLDPLLIESLGRNELSPSIIQSIMALTEQSNVTTISKGVEDLALADRLYKLGLEHLQGYAIGEPVNVLSNSLSDLRVAS